MEGWVDLGYPAMPITDSCYKELNSRSLDHKSNTLTTNHPNFNLTTNHPNFNLNHYTTKQPIEFEVVWTVCHALPVHSCRCL